MEQQVRIQVADERRRLEVTVSIDGKPYTFADRRVTGRQLKQAANIPENYSLYLRRHAGNEPIRDDEVVELDRDDQFFSRPPSNVS
jgi:Multiubiquitin